MKKSIIISVVTASLLSANNVVVLDEVVTVSTATKTEKNIDGVSASVEVVTQKDIEKMGASSLKDVFANVSGLHVQYGTFPSASSKSKSSISLRGMGAKGTLILVDGRRLGGEVANPYDLDRIPASSIEKIEIVKGPMSTLYGADATGGVINIITKKPQEGKPQINFGIRYGQNGDGDDKNKNINFDIKGKENKLGYSFYINQNSTSPYTQKEIADVYAKTPTGKAKPSVYPAGANAVLSTKLQDNYTDDVTYREDSEVLTYGGRLEYDFSDGIKAGVDVNTFKEERNGSYIGYFHPTNFNMGATTNKIAAYNVPVNSNDDNERLDIGADLEITSIEDLILKVRAYRSYYEKRNKTTAKYWADMGYASEEASAQNGMDANVDIRSIETVANYMLNENHLLTGGIEKRTEDREATVFTQSNTLTSKSVDYKAYYLQDEWMVADDLNVVFGARYDDISNADSKATYKLGAVKNFDKAFNLRGNFAQGYRTPDIRELYINKTTPNGVQRGAELAGYDLKPEFTNSYEVGANGRVDRLSYDIAIFYNDIKDMIAEVNKGTYYTFENLPKAKTYGSEFGLKYELSDKVGTRFNWNELKTKNKESGKELEFNPNRIVSAFVDFEVSKDIDTSIGAKYIGSQYYKKTINRGTPTEAIVDDNTGGFTTVDWNMNYSYNKQVALYGGINNLMDKKIEDVLGSSSGRYYFAGMKVSF